MSTLQSEIIRHFIEPMMERDAVMSEATSNDIYIRYLNISGTRSFMYALFNIFILYNNSCPTSAGPNYNTCFIEYQ